MLETCPQRVLVQNFDPLKFYKGSKSKMGKNGPFIKWKWKLPSLKTSIFGMDKNFGLKPLGDYYLIFLSIYSKIGRFSLALRYFFDQSKSSHFIR